MAQLQNYVFEGKTYTPEQILEICTIAGINMDELQCQVIDPWRASWETFHYPKKENWYERVQRVYDGMGEKLTKSPYFSGDNDPMDFLNNGEFIVWVGEYYPRKPFTLKTYNKFVHDRSEYQQFCLPTGRVKHSPAYRDWLAATGLNDRVRNLEAFDAWFAARYLYDSRQEWMPEKLKALPVEDIRVFDFGDYNNDVSLWRPYRIIGHYNQEFVFYVDKDFVVVSIANAYKAIEKDGMVYMLVVDRGDQYYIIPVHKQTVSTPE